MHRVLEINFKGQESSFKVIKIERSKLYGSKRRIPVDAQGSECSFASLTEDGRFILAKGGTALLYLDKQGEVVERNKLQGVDADGKVIQKQGSEILAVEETVQVTDLLNYTMTHAYYLEPVYLSSNLETSLSQGAVYCLPHFNYNGDENRQTFLLSSDAGYFILAGKRNDFEFIGLAEADLSLPDMGEESAVDLDFSMW